MPFTLGNWLNYKKNTQSKSNVYLTKKFFTPQQKMSKNKWSD